MELGKIGFLAYKLGSEISVISDSMCDCSLWLTVKICSWETSTEAVSQKDTLFLGQRWFSFPFSLFIYDLKESMCSPKEEKGGKNVSMRLGGGGWVGVRGTGEKKS